MAVKNITDLHVLGNVGIGTTSPAQKLDVRGFVVSNSQGNGSESAFYLGNSAHGLSRANLANDVVLYTTSGDVKISASTASVTHLIVKNSGNVGIGTTSPSGKLHVKTDASSEFIFTGASTSGYATTFHMDNTGLDIGHNSTGRALNLKTGSLDRLTILGNGNVGIGTTVPAHKLDVVSNQVIARFKSTDSSTSGFSEVYYENDAGVRLIVGSIGSGYTNSAWAGARYMYATAGDLMIKTLGSGTNLRFYTAGATNERMRINGSGNVGIGTTSPVTGLDVRKSAYSNTTARFGETRPVYIINADSIIGFNQYYDGGWKAGTTGYSGNVGMNNSGEMYFNVSTASVATDGAVTNRQAMKIFNDANITWGTGGTGSWGEGLLTMNSGWGTNKYPTLGSYDGSAGSLIMLHNPHVPFRTDNPATGSYTGRAGLRMAIDTGGTSYWDMGLAGDFFHIYKNGTGEFLRIDNTGNVGIGTTSPGVILNLKRTIDTHALNSSINRILIENPSTSFGGSASGIEFDAGTGDVNAIIAVGADGNDNTPQGLVIKTTTNSPVIFATNSGADFIDTTGVYGERMRIDPVGNVGIGTTSPSEKLEVTGNVILDASNARLKIKGGVTGTNSGIDWTFNSDATQYAKIELDYDTRGTTGLLIDSGYPLTLDYSSSRFAVQYNGVEQMRVNTNGNVGIGTTAPGAKLDVNGQGAFSRNYVYGQENYHIALVEDTSTAYVGNVNGSAYLSNSSYYGSQIYNVTPTQTGIASVYAQSTGDILFLTRTFTAGAAAYQQANTSMTIKGNGNVGIGTTSPSHKLYVSGSSAAVANLYSTGFTNLDLVSTRTSGNLGGIRFKQNADAYISVEVNGVIDGGLEIKTGNGDAAPTTRVKVDASGKVGIGTTSPDAHLEISANAAADPSPVTNPVTLRLTDAGSAATGQGDTTNPWAKIEFYSEDASSGGPAVQAQISTIYDDIYSAGSHISFSNTSTPTNGLSEKMRITAGGNVGIGTTSPSEKLEVSGNILASGDITAFSDANLKENVETVFDALDKVKGMRGVTFNKIGEEKRSVGVIAQELLEVLPEAVHKSGEHYSVAYGNIVGVLIEAMKEQQAQIDKLKAIINGSTK